MVKRVIVERCAAPIFDVQGYFLAQLGSRAARDAIRRRIAPLADDRYLKADLDAALALVEDGSVLAAAESAAGALE